MSDAQTEKGSSSMIEKVEATNTVLEVDQSSRGREGYSQDDSDFDVIAYQEHNAGRLVIDPEYVSRNSFQL